MPVGLKIQIRSSKTDQAGAGQDVAVLDGERLRVKAARADWLTTAGITTGPIFRRLGKGARVLAAGLTDRSVANIIKIRAAQAGLDPALFSGHSLRAGGHAGADDGRQPAPQGGHPGGLHPQRGCIQGPRGLRLHVA